MSSLDALKADAVELVLENWKSYSRPIRLARLGQVLRMRSHDLRGLLAKRSLAELLRQELSDKVTVLVDPADSKVLWAIPANVHPNEVHFESPTTRSEQRSAIDRRVIQAFTQTIPEGLVRTLTLEPEIRHQEVHEETATTSGKLIIRPSDIYPIGVPPQPERREELGRRIRAWAQANGIDFGQLEYRSRPRHEQRVSVLEVLIEALEPSELSRITAPLDVIAKLLRSTPR